MKSRVYERAAEVQSFGIGMEHIGGSARLAMRDHIRKCRKQEVVKLLVFHRVVLNGQPGRALEGYAVGRIGKHKVRAFSVHQLFNVLGGSCITAHQTMPTDHPDIAPLHKSGFFKSGGKVVVIVFRIIGVVFDKVLQFLFVKTRK